VHDNAPTIRRVVEGALTHGLRIVVVDDGSTDHPEKALTGLEIDLLRHATNRGKGAALLTAAEHIRGAGGTHMICYDGDGQFDPRDIAAFVDMLRQHPTALVYGVRSFIKGEVPGASVFGRRFSNFWTRLTTGKRVRDSQCGFRAYPVDLLLQLDITSRRYDFEVEALVKACWAGAEPIGIDVWVTYAPAEGRITSFRPVLDNLRISRAYTRLVLRMLLPIPHQVLITDQTTGRARVLSPWHPIAFFQALVQERSSPSQLAAATACGLFLGTLPLIGFHSIAIIVTASMFRLNRLLAFSVSHLCAPPMIPALCIEVGYFLRHGRWLDTFTSQTLWQQLDQRFLEYLWGTLLVAPVVAGAGAALTFVVAHVAVRHNRAKQHHASHPRGKTITARYGSRLGISFFHLVLRLGGVRLAYLFLWFAVPYYVLCRASVRNAAAPYLRRRFPNHGRLRLTAAALANVMEFARCMVDQAAVAVLGPGYFSVTVQRKAELFQLLQGNRGVVLLTTHAGNWRSFISCLDLVDKPVSLLLFRDPSAPTSGPQGLPEVLGPVKVIDPASAFGGLIEATSALLRGELVAIMGDRQWGGRTVPVTFLGDRAWVPESPYRLARSTNARVLCMLVERAGYRRYTISFSQIDESDKSTPADKANAREAQQYVECLERFVEHNPWAWFNFFDFWHAPSSTDNDPRAKL